MQQFHKSKSLRTMLNHKPKFKVSLSRFGLAASCQTRLFCLYKFNKLSLKKLSEKSLGLLNFNNHLCCDDKSVSEFFSLCLPPVTPCSTQKLAQKINVPTTSASQSFPRCGSAFCIPAFKCTMQESVAAKVTDHKSRLAGILLY